MYIKQKYILQNLHVRKKVNRCRIDQEESRDRDYILYIDNLLNYILYFYNYSISTHKHCYKEKETKKPLEALPLIQ